MAQSNAILDRAAGKPVKLNTRDKRLRQALILTDTELSMDRAQGNSMASMTELLREMDMQKKPERKAILQQEYNAILENVAPFVPEAIMTRAPAKGEEKEEPISILDRLINIFK
jgi:hypothetical protein